MKKIFMGILLTLTMVIGLMVPAALAAGTLQVETQYSSIEVGDYTGARLANDPGNYDHLEWKRLSGDGEVRIESSSNWKEVSITGGREGEVVIEVTSYDAAGSKLDSGTFSITVTPKRFYISRDLPETLTTTYGESNILRYEYVDQSPGSKSPGWVVDGIYVRERNPGIEVTEFDTGDLPVGIHKVWGYASCDRPIQMISTRVCTVTVKDRVGNSSDFYISRDLPETFSATYGESSVLSVVLSENFGEVSDCKWYVNGQLDESSTTTSFDTKDLPVSTENKVFCTMYSAGGDCEVSTGVCTVEVKEKPASMDNLRERQTYNNTFTDVAEGDWFAPYVKTAYEYGLVNGKGADTYCPDDSFTVAEALKIATCIREYYFHDQDGTRIGYTPWYRGYVDYMTLYGVIREDDFTDYDAPCTRAQMAYIFSRCLPEEELAPLRDVVIPDCDSNTPYVSEIQMLYNAGIVSGDENHNFCPDQNIKRSEVAKIVCTLTKPAVRDANAF